MKNISLDLSGKVDPITVNLLTLLRDTSVRASAEFFIVGAAARDLLLEKGFGISVGRRTQDVDLGVMVSGWDDYGKLKDDLISTGYFVSKEKNEHRLFFNETLPVDMIPFGGVESPPGSIAWPPGQVIQMNVLGFREALDHSLEIRVGPDHIVRVASLAAMAALKLIAWSDRRHLYLEKDIGDLVLILRNFSSAGNEERLYGDFSDLLETEGFDLEHAGARLLGHDIAEMMSQATKDVMLNILEQEANPSKGDQLIIGIARELPGRDYERAAALLKCLRAGIEGKRPRKI
jgi:predicted nucleotidyltransferase